MSTRPVGLPFLPQYTCALQSCGPDTCASHRCWSDPLISQLSGKWYFLLFSRNLESGRGGWKFQSTTHGSRRHNCLIRKMLFLQSILHNMRRPAVKLGGRSSLPYLAEIKIPIRKQSVKMIAAPRHVRQLMQHVAGNIKGRVIIPPRRTPVPFKPHGGTVHPRLHVNNAHFAAGRLDHTRVVRWIN